MLVKLTNLGDNVRTVYDTTQRAIVIKPGESKEAPISTGLFGILSRARRKGDTLDVKERSKASAERVRVKASISDKKKSDGKSGNDSKQAKGEGEKKGEAKADPNAALEILKKSDDLDYHQLLQQSTAAFGDLKLGPRPTRSEIMQVLREKSQQAGG